MVLGSGLLESSLGWGPGICMCCKHPILLGTLSCESPAATLASRTSLPALLDPGIQFLAGVLWGLLFLCPSL